MIQDYCGTGIAEAHSALDELIMPSLMAFVGTTPRLRFIACQLNRSCQMANSAAKAVRQCASKSRGTLDPRTVHPVICLPTQHLQYITIVPMANQSWQKFPGRLVYIKLVRSPDHGRRHALLQGLPSAASACEPDISTIIHRIPRFVSLFFCLRFAASNYSRFHFPRSRSSSCADQNFRAKRVE